MRWVERPEVLLIFDWRDGPIEGVVRRSDGTECWYFKLFAERFEAAADDDRLFGLWEIPEPDSSLLCSEFGESGEGAQIWPVFGGIGSAEARAIVDGILSTGRELPCSIVRTPDFRGSVEGWDVVIG